MDREERVKPPRKPVVTRKQENQWHVIKVQFAGFAAGKA
jgi:hypothetical protein